MELYPHQVKLLEYLMEHDYAGIFWEQRLGKTNPTLTRAIMLVKWGMAKSCLIIAPKSAIGSWTQDAKSFKGERGKIVQSFDIVNYELVWRRPKYDKFYDIVIIDESHRIAHRTSKQSKFILKYAERSKYRYILSGTPIGQGRLEDLYSQMEFLKKGFFGSYKDFADRYLIQRRLDGTFIKITVGYRNKEELLERVGTMVTSLRFKDLNTENVILPDDVILTGRPSPTIYRQLKDFYVEKYDIIIQNPAVQMMKFRQVSSGFIIDEKHVTHTVSTNKLKMFKDLIDTILPEKIVVFAEFKHSIDSIRKCLNSINERYLILDGNQKNKQCWIDFQQDDSIKVMVCQYASGNAGIDLYKANHMIFFEPSLSTTMTEQARARIQKFGKKEPCAYYWLISEHSIEQKIYAKLEKKKDFTVESMAEWKIK